MNCKKCGAQLAEGTKFCYSCGAEVVEEVVQPRYEAQPRYQQPQSYAQPQYQQPVTAQDLPEQYRPLSAWAYWGLSLLYAVPIVGLVFMIIFSFNSSNINRRSFTRSFWCWYIIIAIVCLISLIVGGGFLAVVANDLY